MVVPVNMERSKCHLMSTRTEICGSDQRKSWVVVWTLGPPHHSSSLTDSAIVSPFIRRSTPENAEFDREKYPVNRTYQCVCPAHKVGNHTYAQVCDFSQSCILDVEEAEGLISLEKQISSRDNYIGTIAVVVGVFLLLISIGGGASIGVIIWYKQWSSEQPASDKYERFTIDDQDEKQN